MSKLADVIEKYQVPSDYAKSRWGETLLQEFIFTQERLEHLTTLVKLSSFFDGIMEKEIDRLTRDNAQLREKLEKFDEASTHHSD